MNTSEPQSPEVDSSQHGRWRKLAITVSILVHVMIALVLLFVYLPDPEPQRRLAGNPASNSQDGARDSRTRGPQRSPPVPQPVAMEEIPAEQIEQSIESQIDQASQLSDEEKLSELERNLRRLESISDSESIQQVTTTIADTLGLDSQAYDPNRKPSEGAFDFDTAQLHDVTRQKDDKGQWKYESVLVDSSGRKMVVPMEASEGETMYSTFEQMKKYPLAETIYRGTVMPMLQSLLDAEKQKRIGGPSESDDEEIIEEVPNNGFGGGGIM